MKKYQEDYLNLAIRQQVLKFGEFTLKSGRVSPYFVNTGEIDNGVGIMELGECYAQLIIDHFSHDSYDVIFGLAYKGIPLAVATVIALSSDYSSGAYLPDLALNKRFAFDRKIVKEHGEGTDQKSLTVGTKIRDGDRILIIDDVITTAQTKIDTIYLLKTIADVQIAGVVISIDRMEIYKEGSDETAVEYLAKLIGAPVIPIVTIKDAVMYLYHSNILVEEKRSKMEQYFDKYCPKRLM